MMMMMMINEKLHIGYIHSHGSPIARKISRSSDCALEPNWRRIFQYCRRRRTAR